MTVFYIKVKKPRDSAYSIIGMDGTQQKVSGLGGVKADLCCFLITYLAHESTQGKNPRSFAIDPTGAFLLAANQDTDTIVTFRIDRETGMLIPTGHVAQVPTPACLKLARSGG